MTGTAAGAEPVRQRATLVLPSDGAFDSRAWRIAGSLAARGHEVTIVARSAAGLAAREDHPAGYRILRVPVSAAAGLPRPLRGIAGRRRPGVTTPGGHAAPAGGRAAPAEPGSTPRGGPIATLRSATGAVRRLAAIGLTVRAQRLATERVAPPADLVHAMAYMGIPVGLALGRRDRAPVVYDARDIYVRARNIARLPGPARRLFATIERRWARAADRVVTVNDPYATVMAGQFGVRPLVVMNGSYRRDTPVADAAERRLSAVLGLDATRRIVLYHGGLSPDRGIEQLIAALPLLPADAVLVLLGYGPLRDALEARSADPELAGRLRILPAVAPDELIDWVASADVAAMPIQPSSLNHRLATPNTLFEAMAAGVPVVASDLPGMAAIVRETGCGVLCDPADPGSIASAILSILEAPEEERAAIRDRAMAAARGRYSWEAQLEVLLAEYTRLTGRPW